MKIIRCRKDKGIPFCWIPTNINKPEFTPAYRWLYWNFWLSPYPDYWEKPYRIAWRATWIIPVMICFALSSIFITICWGPKKAAEFWDRNI